MHIHLLLIYHVIILVTHYYFNVSLVFISFSIVAENYRDIRGGGGFNGHDDRFNDVSNSATNQPAVAAQQPTRAAPSVVAQQPTSAAPESLYSDDPPITSTRGRGRGRIRGRARGAGGGSVGRGGGSERVVVGGEPQRLDNTITVHSEQNGARSSGPDASSQVPGGPVPAQIPGGPEPVHVPGGPDPSPPLPERVAPTSSSQAPGGPGTSIPGGPGLAAVVPRRKKIFDIGPPPRGCRIVEPKGDIEIHIPGMGRPPPPLGNKMPGGAPSRLVEPKGDLEVRIPGMGPLGPAPQGRVVQPKGDVEVPIPGIGPLGPAPQGRLVQPKGDVEVHIPGVYSQARGPPGIISTHVPGAPGSPSQVPIPGGPTGTTHTSQSGGGGGFHGGCPPEGALAGPIGVWEPTDDRDALREIPKDEEEEQKEDTRQLTVNTQSGPPQSPPSPLSPGDGWTTPTDHIPVVDWAAESNNNDDWNQPLSPGSEMYDFNPQF